jgi:hypothetical protein
MFIFASSRERGVHGHQRHVNDTSTARQHVEGSSLGERGGGRGLGEDLTPTLTGSLIGGGSGRGFFF